MGIEVNLPDGSIASFPEGTTPDVMKAAIQKKFPPMNIAGEALAPFAGFNEVTDATLNLPGNLMNLGIKGINAASDALGYGNPITEYQPIQAATRFNSGYEPQTLPGKFAKAGGEVVGGLVAPEAGLISTAARMAPATLRTAAPVLQQAAKTTAASLVKDAALPALGATTGITAAREADLGPVGEIAGGMIGGMALPNTLNAGARTYSGVKAGLEYAGKQIERAQNPEAAA